MNDNQLDNSTIENMRRTMGTLPSQKEETTYDYYSAFDEKASITKMIDNTTNPYFNICEFCTSTWGSVAIDAEGSCNKWKYLTPKSRFIICLSALQGQTLPTALETVNMMFEFRNVPRSSFDQFARARIGHTFASIGQRDNCRNSAALILYPERTPNLLNP